MSNVYFTSDLHLGHKLVSAKRGFKFPSMHDEAVIASLKVLNKRDILWILGDIAFSPAHLNMLRALSYQKYAVLGNHDKMQTSEYLKHFQACWGAVKKYDAWITHMPVHPQEMLRVKVNIHGHIHKTGKTSNLGFPYINVNWDFWKRPVSLQEIKDEITRHTS